MRTLRQNIEFNGSLEEFLESLTTKLINFGFTNKFIGESIADVLIALESKT